MTIEYPVWFMRRSPILLSISLLLSFHQTVTAQTDTSSLKSLYDRVLDFNRSKADSILYYANYIEEHARESGFEKGAVLSLRLKGIYWEFREEYDSAIQYYYRTLEQARKLNTNEYEPAALGDLAMAYNNIKQPEMARDFFKEALRVSRSRKEAMSVFVQSTNLGSVYSRLGYPDSALLFLEEAEDISKKYNLEIDKHFLYNNMGNAWFYKKEWDKALRFFKINYETNLLNNEKELLWYDCLNIGDVFIGKKNFDSARKYIDQSFDLAKQLGSKQKEADVYSLYAKFYSNKGNYKDAFLAFEEWHKLDTSLVNQRTLQTVARLQENYNLKQAIQNNRLLELEVDKQKLGKRNIFLMSLGIGALAVFALTGLIFIRRKNNLQIRQNELIQKQNNKLAQLNAEKNSLISVVSHDLNAPFTSIKMWSNILLSDATNLSEEQKNALYRIQSSADNGELLIKNILYIEKEEIKQHALSLEELDLNSCLEDIVDMHRVKAQQKEISFHFSPAAGKVLLMSDRQMLSRICDNLLSNAVKFTPRGKNVWVSLIDDKDTIQIRLEDEGVGIAQEDIPYLFAKYKKISSAPTEGEYSTGLGLSIVKRLVEELNGTVVCKSELGKGSVFTVTLKK